MPNKILLNLTVARGVEDSRPPLNEFTNVCSALRNCLKNLSRCVGQDGAQFAISNLYYGSAVLEAEPRSSEWEEVTYLFNRTILDLEEGRRVDPRLDYSAIHCFHGFSGPINNEDLDFAIGGTVLTKQYVANLTALLEPASPELGSVSGDLQSVTIHNKNEFMLYPPIAGEEVKCNFDTSALHHVVEALGKNVTVFGKVFFSATKALPSRVDVETFEVNPPNENLPTLLDARGILTQPENVQDPLIEGCDDEWD